MTSLAMILLIILNVAFWFVIAHVIMSWLIQFQIVNLHQPFVAAIWRMLVSMLEPVYGRVRRFLPAMGGLDLAPLVVLVAIMALQIVIQNNLTG